ncbi:hypothetical protein FOL47_001130 [Perkinsus chesapeaki]|uniref:Uncharacterized protein n=1 Tax=Perkinsus chesapeaki TaxID=330153 RepID=A0A7J6KU94_PERCH|nr:hypothetical protein FOL47_001130 [Perkinsus chesapeaki]
MTPGHADIVRKLSGQLAEDWDDLLSTPTARLVKFHLEAATVAWSLTSDEVPLYSSTSNMLISHDASKDAYASIRYDCTTSRNQQADAFSRLINDVAAANVAALEDPFEALSSEKEAESTRATNLAADAIEIFDYDYPLSVSDSLSNSIPCLSDFCVKLQTFRAWKGGEALSPRDVLHRFIVSEQSKDPLCVEALELLASKDRLDRITVSQRDITPAVKGFMPGLSCRLRLVLPSSTARLFVSKWRGTSIAVLVMLILKILFAVYGVIAGGRGCAEIQRLFILDVYVTKEHNLCDLFCLMVYASSITCEFTPQTPGKPLPSEHKGLDWYDVLALGQLRINTTVHPDLGISPHEVVYGIPHSFPLVSFLCPSDDLSEKDIEEFVCFQNRYRRDAVYAALKKKRSRQLRAWIDEWTRSRAKYQKWDAKSTTTTASEPLLDVGCRVLVLKSPSHKLDGKWSQGVGRACYEYSWMTHN